MNLKHLLTKLNPFKKPEVIEEPEAPIEKTEEPVRKQHHPKNNPLTEGNSWKLSEPEKQMIVSWFATGLSLSECAQRAKDELNVEISPMQISKYTRGEKWQALIKSVRKATMDDLAEVAGSHKKVRLSRHERVYDKAIKKNDLKNAMLATENQRKEMEEQSINLTLNQFNILSDEELKLKHQEVLERIKNISNKGAIDVKPTN